MGFGTLIEYKCFNLELVGNEQQTISFYPGVATMLQMTNKGTEPIDVQINGCVETFSLPPGDTQTFSNGDIHGYTIGFQCSHAGKVCLIAGVTR